MSRPAPLSHREIKIARGPFDRPAGSFFFQQLVDGLLTVAAQFVFDAVHAALELGDVDGKLHRVDVYGL